LYREEWGVGVTRHNDRSDKLEESRCGPWFQRCDLSECLTRESKQYPKKSKYNMFGYDKFGSANSNTYAYTLAARCGITTGPALPRYVWTPGAGSKPADPL